MPEVPSLFGVDPEARVEDEALACGSSGGGIGGLRVVDFLLRESL